MKARKGNSRAKKRMISHPRKYIMVRFFPKRRLSVNDLTINLSQPTRQRKMRRTIRFKCSGKTPFKTNSENMINNHLIISIIRKVSKTTLRLTS